MELETDSVRKIVIYDASRGFSRFIKAKLQGHYSVKVINSKSGLKKHKLTNSCIVFYIVNDPLDAMQFTNVYGNVDLLFLGIAVKNLKQRFIKYTSVVPMNLELPKKELMEYIQHHLQTK